MNNVIGVGITILRLLLAAFFLFLACKNLGGDATMKADFARWGYPDWFRILTGTLQIAAALLLPWSSTASYGAGLIGCMMVGAIITHLRWDPPATAVSPLVILLIAVAVGTSMRDKAWRPNTRSTSDYDHPVITSKP